MVSGDKIPFREVKIVSVSQARERLQTIRPRLRDLKRLFEEYKLMEMALNEASTVEEITRQRYLLDLKEEEMIDLHEFFTSHDCVIKDWSTGLVDFISLREDEKVWLCFQEGEKELRYFHGWNDGFAGRRLIDFD